MASGEIKGGVQGKQEEKTTSPFASEAVEARGSAVAFKLLEL